MTDYLQEQYRTSHLSGSNAAYVEELYELWLDDAEAVPEHWQTFFNKLADGASDDTRHLAVAEHFRGLAADGMAYSGSMAEDFKQAGVLRMINAYRVRGHQRAKLDPLGLSERPKVPDLDLEFHSLSEADLKTTFHTGSLAAPDHLTLGEIVDICRSTYCGSIGVEYMHIADTNQRRWLQQRLEGTRGHYTPPAEDRLRLLEKLAAAEGMEKYLHSRYVGQKRFSLEGAESVIPLFDTLIRHSGSQGIKEMVIGMAHRGRLNVQANVLGKPYEEIFRSFEEQYNPDAAVGGGDVKYHSGFDGEVE
ncbi:MAG: 2-oxoglutarate dehydrogenase E1 subunit family protein, partial [Wenzhouxiangella sp.]